MSTATRPQVLVVDADDALRRMVRFSLELDGVEVIEAATLAEARHAVAELPLLSALILDPELPDGDGMELCDAVGGAAVIVEVERGTDLLTRPATAGHQWVEKGDLRALGAALQLPHHDTRRRRLAVCDILDAEAEEIARDWRELCEWDPMLPPDSRPPIAGAVLDALAAAMTRPQPLGWGADPEIEKVAEVFSRAVGAVDVVIGQLVCLREVVRRRVASRIPPDEAVETDDRLHMILDRAIAVAASQAAERLQEEAYLDPLTELLNRRGLERDLRREIARAERYGRRFTLVLLDLDNLKQVNDTAGHVAGDERLRQLARAVQGVLRSGDSAYRVGGDEFVLLLPETSDLPVSSLMERIEPVAPPFGWGAALFPDDGGDLADLFDAADVRMAAHKKERGRR